MVDLSRGLRAEVHRVTADPGLNWTKDGTVVIDAPPDAVGLPPLPEATWPLDLPRSGICGVVAPRVVRLRTGGYRLYFTQILPRAGFPSGANDYGNATARILSAISPDGVNWAPEPGVRVSPEQVGAGVLRIVSSDVVPAPGETDLLRMYYESAGGTLSEPSEIRSATSTDGLTWTPDPGPRVAGAGRNFAAPRLLWFTESDCRLYCMERGRGIVSFLSVDGGLNFREEPGLRVAKGGANDSQSAFAPEIMRLPGGQYVMYYAGYASPACSSILRAVSDDGLEWRKFPEPVVSPGGRWDAAKSSEMCVYALPCPAANSTPRFRMLYEGCDGTAPNQRGVWRILGATAVPAGVRM